MAYNVKDIAPPGYFEKLEDAKIAALQRQIELSPAELLKRIERLEKLVEELS